MQSDNKINQYQFIILDGNPFEISGAKSTSFSEPWIMIPSEIPPLHSLSPHLPCCCPLRMAPAMPTPMPCSQPWGSPPAMGNHRCHRNIRPSAYSLDWFKGKFTGNPWFLPLNIGLSCKFSHNPILWPMFLQSHHYLLQRVLLWRILEPKQIQDFSGRLVVETAVMLIRESDVEQDRGRRRKSGNSYIIYIVFLDFIRNNLFFVSFFQEKVSFLQPSLAFAEFG